MVIYYSSRRRECQLLFLSFTNLVQSVPLSIVVFFNRRELWFSKCMHLRNPWNDNKEVKICRDGQVKHI